MKRLIEAIVFVGLVTAWRFAGAPTRRVPSFWKATTEGVVRAPSRFVITVGSPPSMTATTELVVPRSMPMILDLLLMSGQCLERPSCGPVIPERSLPPPLVGRAEVGLLSPENNWCAKLAAHPRPRTRTHWGSPDCQCGTPAGRDCTCGGPAPGSAPIAAVRLAVSIWIDLAPLGHG